MKQLYRMIRWTLVVLLALAGMRAQAQAPGWADAMQVVSPGTPGGFSMIDAMTTDASGNIVLAGVYYGTVKFGSVEHTSAERYTVFVTKWNIVTKEFDWVAEAPTMMSHHAVGLVRNGNSYYLLGVILNASGFNSTSFGTTELTPHGYLAHYVTRLTDTGSTQQFDWAMLMTDENWIMDYGICVSGGHTYLTGEFSESELQLDNLALPSAGGYPTRFIARLNDPGMAGGVVWAKSLGRATTSRGAEMGIVGNGPNLYLTGTFKGTTTIGTTVLRAGPAEAVYVAKVVDDGTTGRVAWARQFGCKPGTDYSTLAVQDSTIYLASTAGTDAIAFDNLILPAGDSGRAYVARLTDRGTCDWVQATTGPGDAFVLRLAKGAQVYLAGTINFFAPGNVQFGATTLMGNPAPVRRGDAFIARLTDNGNYATFDWAQTVGGTEFDIVQGLTWAGSELYMLGVFESPSIDFGTPPLGSISPTDSPFLVRIPDAGATTTLVTRPGAAPLIYPNPAHTTALVQLPAHATLGTPATLTVLDALGRPVRTETLRLATYATAHPLDLTGLAPGLYLVRLAANGRTATQRLVVE
ncbi:T9SS type A sorting domain-containing protein [Hymenobacter sp. ASUV-10]|uniref:T9SS type A sorting domain-containing protein n=1 Tax=Hymenobacter aranciens TaxID=3063996 RepID=A0ABT9B6P0_9BACT|nr:T9SS type A sorting domain-containing protein [Hymenobacter sp. ASUV-10]MDO7873369.1 T9SS type A sorting domain-containing protein [Hymenobacter sp. ASUV-10]